MKNQECQNQLRISLHMSRVRRMRNCCRQRLHNTSILTTNNKIIRTTTVKVSFLGTEGSLMCRNSIVVELFFCHRNVFYLRLKMHNQLPLGRSCAEELLIARAICSLFHELRSILLSTLWALRESVFPVPAGDLNLAPYYVYK